MQSMIRQGMPSGLTEGVSSLAIRSGAPKKKQVIKVLILLAKASLAPR
jgi:hypothetical protein